LKPEPCLEPVFCESDCTRASEESSREVPCCYDADTSNSSMDFNLSQDEVSQDSHHRGFGEAAARGAKYGSFFPISEETVFLDSPPTIPTITTTSPLSIDSWMVYSNSSSDEYSHINGMSSNDDTSDFETCLPRKNTLQFADLELEDDEDEDLTAAMSHKSLTKRIRVKEQSRGRSRSGAPANVDVRMIDFAHTSFVTTSDESSSGVVHQGPDGGFLTGLDSLKRLLSQILAEG
jgi:inositol-hexakisphosphate kinase